MHSNTDWFVFCIHLTALDRTKNQNQNQKNKQTNKQNPDYIHVHTILIINTRKIIAKKVKIRPVGVKSYKYNTLSWILDILSKTAQLKFKSKIFFAQTWLI